MRSGKVWAVLAMLVLASCSSSTPFRDMVGYVPPTSLPAQPKRTLVQDRPANVWNSLIASLRRSDFEIDHVDREKRLIVARYSGNPEPFVDCGSIVTHENGALGQISGSARDVSLNYRLEDQPVVLRRGLNLDSRIIIRLQEQRHGTVISTDTTYVVTKTVDVEATSGSATEGSRETVSFSAGKRAEFSKGTACQPNGSLDVAVLRNLPNVIGSNEITRADLPIDSFNQIADSKTTWRDQPNLDQDDRDQPTILSFDDEHLDAAILPPTANKPTPPPSEKNWTYSEPALNDDETKTTTQATPSDQQEGAGPDLPEQLPAPTLPQSHAAVDQSLQPETVLRGKVDDAASIVDETTETLLTSLDCQGVEWHFCDAVELTAPYRKRNIEKAAGLTVNTIGDFTSQLIGDDLELNVALPDFPSYLHIFYLGRDGMIGHVTASPTLWPANVTHHLEETDHAIPGPSGLAMIVAFVTEQPLMPDVQTGKKEAGVYLDDLKQQLAKFNSLAHESRIVATQLLINVE